jgi:SAM-dependent methyltransferase
MQTDVIQRQYDEIIASHYDFDPQSVIGDSLDRAIQQINRFEDLDGERSRLRVLDLGLGTGRFLEKLRAYAGNRVQPFGLDISRQMIDIACTRIPDLVSAVADVAKMDAHFQGRMFDLAATHFITGFVPLRVLAPKVAGKLQPGGLWSFVGGTRGGFPVLQKKAQAKLARILFRLKTLDLDDFVCNPADEREVVETLQRHGFTLRACETFRPPVRFRNLEEFLEFAYYGGWLTPFVESFGIHRAPPMLRTLWDKFFFPVNDHHSVVIALAEKSSC